MKRKEKTPIRGLFFSALIFLIFGSGVCLAGGEAPGRTAIATAHPAATEAGLSIMAEGGNAFDAAVAVSAVLAVVEPYSSGLGGGGFWLLHRASDGFQVMVDGRERAPSKAHRDLYLDAQGEVIPGLSIDGPLAAGIPGEPAALAHIAEKYGRLPLSRSLGEAIRLAREGFIVDDYYRRMARWRLDALRRSVAAAEQFLQNGEVPPAGTLIKQPDLARTLERIAIRGRDGFYAGETARLLIEGVNGAGGIWSREDLDGYRIVERAPIRGEYRGFTIVSAPPPSSGGVALMTMLNILSGFPLSELSSVERKHLVIEAMRRAYRDRADFLGDPDFIGVPIERLTHPLYAQGLARDISKSMATPSVPKSTVTAGTEGRDTTHFSILDAEGNRVAATLSVNYPFGGAYVAPGTGVLLNDEMDDFSARPGVPNVYGLTGGEANAIAGNKRMLSSMTPTFVESDAGVAILGSPGGSRIITMVLHGILSLVAGDPPSAWVAKPRFHHQFLPDQVQFEPDALDAGERAALSQMGHSLQPLERSYGNMQAVYWDRGSGEVLAASDPRGIGAATVR